MLEIAFVIVKLAVVLARPAETLVTDLVTVALTMVVPRPWTVETSVTVRATLLVVRALPLEALAAIGLVAASWLEVPAFPALLPETALVAVIWPVVVLAAPIPWLVTALVALT